MEMEGSKQLLCSNMEHENDIVGRSSGATKHFAGAHRYHNQNLYVMDLISLIVQIKMEIC